MQLGDLSRYHISERVIDAWRKRQGEQLLPVQSRAIRQGLLDRPGAIRRRPNMIVSAPTSSGKSFCAELAAIKALADRRRAVLLFPLKSLAEEKYRLFVKTYGPLGIKCLIATGDHPENDKRFASGDYHIALAIHEKFDLALTNRLDLLQNIGLIVVDEIQMISEPGRGFLLERMLTKVLASSYNPEIVALSAVLTDRRVEPLADWLDAVLVEETQRPRDLIRGVAAEGKLIYRSYNDAVNGTEAFLAFDPMDDSEQAMKLFADRIKADGGRTLLFLKSRADTVNLALRLAGSQGYPAAEKVIACLSDEEPSRLLRSLTQALSHGVAFHNSDLSGHQREAVEQGFIDGEIQLLCTTTTLALGVNLPADTVYLETVKYTSGQYDSRPELVPISRGEFDNMTGRAGRLGFDSDRPARAIVMAESAFDSEVIWDIYLGPVTSKPIESAWSSQPLEDWVLHMIVTGLAKSLDDLSSLYDRSLHAVLQRDSATDKKYQFKCNMVVERLLASGLISSDDDSILAATPVGNASARSGLTVADATHYLKAIAKSGRPESKLGWTFLALSAPGWNLPPAALSWYEQANNMAVKMLYQRFDHSVEEAAFLLPENHRRQPLSYRTAASLKSTLVLDEWCRLVPVRELEERYRWHLGQLQALGRTAAHLVAALGSLIGATDPESEQPEVLTQLAFSLRFGLPPELQEMHKRLGSDLRRTDFLQLYQAGIESVEELVDAGEQLDELLSDPAKAKRIREIAINIKEEVDMQPATMNALAPVGQQPSVIEIDGTYESDRYLIRINGFPVRLTGKSFKYLAKLAWSRVNGGSGWVYKEDIEVGFNQARYLYRMKSEISAAFRSDWSVVENNRLGYYRLHIDPTRIKLNLDNLRDHPDYELRTLFQSRSGPDAVN